MGASQTAPDDQKPALTLAEVNSQSICAFVDCSALAPPGAPPATSLQWRPIEAEELDPGRLEELSTEVYGY